MRDKTCYVKLDQKHCHAPNATFPKRHGASLLNRPMSPAVTFSQDMSGGLSPGHGCI